MNKHQKFGLMKKYQLSARSIEYGLLADNKNDILTILQYLKECKDEKYYGQRKDKRGWI